MRVDSLSDIVEKQKRVAELISSAKLDVEELQSQTIDEEVFNFFCGRFNIFYEDGFPDAIDLYLNHMNKDKSINALTKLRILYEGIVYKEMIKDEESR